MAKKDKMQTSMRTALQESIKSCEPHMYANSLPNRARPRRARQPDTASSMAFISCTETARLSVQLEGRQHGGEVVHSRLPACCPQERAEQGAP